MNKQTITGFVIIAIILFGFSWYQNSQQKKFQERQRIEDSIARANAPEPAALVSDGAEVAAPTGQAAIQGVAGTALPAADPLGETLAAARAAEAETFSVSNDLATFEFSTLGGVVSDVVLKDYKKYGGDALHLWKPGSELFDIAFFIRQQGRDAQVNTRNFNFECTLPESTEWREGEEFKKVSMRLPVSGADEQGGREAYLEFVYTIPRADYMIGFTVDFVGMEGLLSNQSSFDVDWANTSLQNEKGFDNENNYTTIAYRYPDKKSVEQLGLAREGGAKDTNERSRVQWVAFKQQFFSSILIADDAFRSAEMKYNTHRAGSGEVKDFKARLSVPMDRGKSTYGFRIYLGPNKFSTLKSYDLSLERLITLGALSFGGVSRLLLVPIFDWLGGRIAGFGWVILIMTIIIKLLILPLTLPSYKSSAKMKIIKPEVDEINVRYPDKQDAMKKQQATMELYRRAGINPLAGCIPTLIQFPIIAATFRFFPVAIELRGQRLWWAEDLSSYDSILDLGFKIPFYGDHISLFTLLMAISMFFFSWMNLRQQTSQPQMAGMKFMMLYMMPAMMLFLFNNYSSGLCFYYTLGNLFTMAQIYGARFFINEEKLRKKMLDGAKKPKKKSGFMARLEEAQKAQLAAARQQQQQAQKGGKKR